MLTLSCEALSSLAVEGAMVDADRFLWTVRVVRINRDNPHGMRGLVVKLGILVPKQHAYQGLREAGTYPVTAWCWVVALRRYTLRVEKELIDDPSYFNTKLVAPRPRMKAIEIVDRVIEKFFEF